MIDGATAVATAITQHPGPEAGFRLGPPVALEACTFSFIPYLMWL
jgi:hypothetical protein